MIKNKLTIVELFAGVGGFRLGFEGVNNDKPFETVFANQWEPSTRNQFAYECYVKNFSSQSEKTIISNEDISKVKAKDIPRHDILVGGFPCQDYSVAQSGAKGIQGKKGVLWWEIYRIAEYHKPKYILLENVDRLLKSPKIQRGRDFAIILKCLDEIGYNVEWRVINAAEYGKPQRRRRVFIFATRKESKIYKNEKINEIIFKNGFFASTFQVNEFINDEENKVENPKSSTFKNKSVKYISDNFEFIFENSGCMIEGEIVSIKTFPVELSSEQKAKQALKNIVDRTKKPIDEKFYLTKEQRDKNDELKGSKSKERVKPNGEKYNYTEGKMNPTEDLLKPARTMLTSEGTINRSSHFIKEEKDKIRKITPEEAEQINTFPVGWTDTGMTDRQRYFCMGNALVVELIEEMSNKIIDLEEKEL